MNKLRKLSTGKKNDIDIQMLLARKNDNGATMAGV